MKLKSLCIVLILVLIIGAVPATAYANHPDRNTGRFRKDITGMISELSRRVEGRVPEEKMREKFSSLSREERLLIISLYEQMERTESGPGREIAVSLIMALIVLS